MGSGGALDDEAVDIVVDCFAHVRHGKP